MSVGTAVFAFADATVSAGLPAAAIYPGPFEGEAASESTI